MVDPKGPYTDSKCLNSEGLNQCEKLPLVCYKNMNINPLSPVTPVCDFPLGTNNPGKCWENCYNHLKGNNPDKLDPANVIGILSNEGNNTCGCWDLSWGKSKTVSDQTHTIATSTPSNFNKVTGNETGGSNCSYQDYDPKDIPQCL